MPKFITLLLALLISIPTVWAKKTITMMSEDGVTITADLYYKSADLPYVLMFHQDNSSRGEYQDIAPRIMDMGYNCLAVDLRVGGSSNYIENETSKSARSKGLQSTYLETENDIATIIEYAYKKSGQPVIMFGSSYSSALCIKLGINNARVGAMVVFEPGEFLKPDYLIKENAAEIDKPVFVATTSANLSYVKSMFSATDAANLTYYYPNSPSNLRGAKVLWPDNTNNKDYWLSLLLFFSKL